MRTLYFLTFVLAVTAVGANGAETITPAPPATTATEQPKKVICVRSLADTGSHLGASKVCHTENEWLMIHNQSARTMERYDTETQTKMPSGGR